MVQIQRVEFRTKAQIVFDELRRRIAVGELAPGERLLLKAIAEEFDCSEIPVREAFRSLAAIGFVDLIPHGGAHVSGLRADELIELTEIRAILEPEATAAAMPHIGATALKDLECFLDEMDDAAAQCDGALYGRLNRRFHARIIEHCPNQKLVALVTDLWERAERGRIVFRDDPAHLDHSTGQHREIVAAIVARDETRLRNVAIAHSRFWLDAVRRLATAPFDPPRAAASGGAG